MSLIRLALFHLSLLLFSTASIESAAQQTPLFDDKHTGTSISSWRFNFSSAAPHYFASIHGLLQQWPNTFFPNGHSIAVGTVPPFTKLYHGHPDSDSPANPEWVAFDIEMSYGIMGSEQDSHMFTYQTTRPVSVLYFDGESATLMGTGKMDTQMLHLYGNVTGPKSDRGWGLWAEYERAIGLCGWISEQGLGGLGWGFEGVVRMNAGFEMIWCNFTSPSLRLISHLNVSAPLLPEQPTSLAQTIMAASGTDTYYPLPPQPTKTDQASNPTNPATPPNWRSMDREPFLRSQGWEWFVSATTHYGSSGLGPGTGERRVKLDSCGLMNYYDPRFESAASARAKTEQTSLNLTVDGLWLGPGNSHGNNSRLLALQKLMRRRRAHVLNGVSRDDATMMRVRSEQLLRDVTAGNRAQCSGIDWLAITGEIVLRNAVAFLNLNDTLALAPALPSTNYSAVRNWMTAIRDETHAFLLPFLEFPSDPEDETIWSVNSALHKATFARCKYHHTRLLTPEEGIHLGPEEKTMKWAVESTMDGICTVMVTTGLAIERIWATEFNKYVERPADDWKWKNKYQKEALYWHEGVEELMSWLGWAGEWVRCEERCAWDEKCHVPMWPLINFGIGQPRKPRGDVAEIDELRDRSELATHFGDDGPEDGPPDGDKPRPPRYGYPYGPGRRRPGGPGWRDMDDTDLWEPKCITSNYIVRGGV